MCLQPIQRFPLELSLALIQGVRLWEGVIQDNEKQMRYRPPISYCILQTLRGDEPGRSGNRSFDWRFENGGGNSVQS